MTKLRLTMPHLHNSQVEPYMRATCVNMPDPAPPASQVDALAAQVAALDDVMRSVQMLASKFRWAGLVG